MDFISLQALSLKNVLNSTTLLEHLGTIGTAFTPAELSYMEGLNYHVFGIFGAATGWGNEQVGPHRVYLFQKKWFAYNLHIRPIEN